MEALYLYRWQFYPTLLYYSGKNNLYKINNLQDHPQKGLLLIPKPLYSSLETISPGLKTGIVYQGQSAILIKLNK